MSAYAYGLSILPQMYGFETPAPLCTKAKIEFSELVRPDGYWPQPYSIEQAFQVYRWMVMTGEKFTDSGRYGVYDLFLGRGTLGTRSLHYEPITSLAQLRQRFHYAILGRLNGKLSQDWREKEKIAWGESRVLHFPHRRPFVGTPLLGQIASEAQIKKVIEDYFSVEGTLRVQLNSCHTDAVEIIQAVVRVETWKPYLFKFDLQYGVDGSGWWHELAHGENFIDALGEALVEFERVSGQKITVGR